VNFGVNGAGFSSNLLLFLAKFGENFVVDLGIKNNYRSFFFENNCIPSVNRIL